MIPCSLSLVFGTHDCHGMIPIFVNIGFDENCSKTLKNVCYCGYDHLFSHIHQ